jgi:hypothetical protein
MVPGGLMVTGGALAIYLHHYNKVISPVQKGRDYSEENQRHSRKGSNPKESSGRGHSPKERTTLFH